MKKSATRAILAAACAGAPTASLLAGTGAASAASVTGWVGPAGTGYLDTSTIINAPDLTAQSKIYSTVGTSAAAGALGVRPRLFKSGALCEAVDYQYNFYSTPELTAGTTATCGTGSYNSHGFVAVWNASKGTYDQYVTFPSNPLNWAAPAARSAKATSTITASDLKSGVNAAGKSYGSAATDGAQPDLILAIGTNGKVGYVRSVDLNNPVANNPQAALQAKPAPRSIPLTDTSGTTTVGTFEVN